MINNSKFLPSVLSLFPSKDSPIIFNRKVEGQSINSSGQFVVGPKAGPDRDVSNLCHELSHFVELDIDRLNLWPHNSWGLSFGKFWQIGNQSGYEHSTNQAVLREQRVWAFQISQQVQLGLSDFNFSTARELVESVIYLDAWIFYQPFKERTHKNSDRIDKLAEETLKMSETDQYGYDSWISRWKKRISSLQKNKIRSLV